MVKDRQAGDSDLEVVVPTSYSERRKLKKVQVERHRRERINRSMSALRDLVCQGQPDQAVDIDRAQVLELAVKCIQTYQSRATTPRDVTSGRAYRVGYEHCSQKITAHLNHVGADPAMKARLMNRLSAAPIDDVMRYAPEVASRGQIPIMCVPRGLPVDYSRRRSTESHDSNMSPVNVTTPLRIDCSATVNAGVFLPRTLRLHPIPQLRIGTPQQPRPSPGVDANNNPVWRPW